MAGQHQRDALRAHEVLQASIDLLEIAEQVLLVLRLIAGRAVTVEDRRPSPRGGVELQLPFPLFAAQGLGKTRRHILQVHLADAMPRPLQQANLLLTER
jgi:hypothetical protein